MKLLIKYHSVYKIDLPYGLPNKINQTHITEQKYQLFDAMEVHHSRKVKALDLQS